MDNKKKITLALIVDVILIVLIVFAVRALVLGIGTDIIKLLCKIGIVIAIPVGFIVSYMAFAGDKYILSNEEYEAMFGEEKDDEEDSVEGENK